MALNRKQVAARRRQKLDRRDAKMREEYARRKREGWTTERIVTDLAAHYDLEPDTIRKILWTTKTSTV